MHDQPKTLACYGKFGSVFRCSQGHIHVQRGSTTLTFNKDQFLRFVAMLTDSANNFELILDSEAPTDTNWMSGYKC